MYRLANESSHRRGPHALDLLDGDDPSTAFPSLTGTGSSPILGGIVANGEGNTKPMDTESERRRLLRKLRTSSISNLRKGAAATFVDQHGPDEDRGDSHSMHSTKSVGMWWQRARETLRKGSNKKPKRHINLRPFQQWRKKDNKTTKYNEMPNHHSQLEAFFDMESSRKIKASRSNVSKPDHDNIDTKSVSSTKSLSSFLRPMFGKKKAPRQVSRASSFAEEEFSVEVQSATARSRPTLTRQGSSFIRRLLRPKQDLKAASDESWSDATPSFPDRLTPTTTDATVSENEEDEYLTALDYESEDEEEEEEVFEEEPIDNENHSDEEDEDITLFFRPIEPCWEDPPKRSVPDRWSPSPSPSLEIESAPKLPVRRPMPDEEVDFPPKQPIARKDDSVVFPAPAPIRAKPKPTWSGESSIMSLISGLVATFSDCSSKNETSVDGPARFSAAPPKKGILKKGSSITPAGKFPIRVKPNRSVSFDSIFVREYERVLGDNPACGSGPPISIGWAYANMAASTLDEYECTKKPRARSKRELYLSASRRKDLLVHEWNFPEEELRQARRDAQYIQYLRSKSAGIVSQRRVARKPSADHSDTSQPSLRRETAERATRYSPTPEIMRLRSQLRNQAP